MSCARRASVVTTSSFGHSSARPRAAHERQVLAARTQLHPVRRERIDDVVQATGLRRLDGLHELRALEPRERLADAVALARVKALQERDRPDAVRGDPTQELLIER